MTNPTQDKPGTPPPPPLPAQPPPQPPADPVLTDGLTASEERTLAELSDKRAAALAASPGQVEVRIDPPHSEMQFGGYVIGNDWQAVPESALTPLAVAAADAGVTLTQKEV